MEGMKDRRRFGELEGVMGSYLGDDVVGVMREREW